jgi:hypothetical protein
MLIRRILPTSLAAVLLSAPLLAQNKSVPREHLGGEAILDRMGFPSNAPFTASWKATRAERGTTWTNSGKEARDSSATTLIEVESVTFNQAHMSDSATFDVLDIKNHTDFYWDTNSKQATLTHLPRISDEKQREIDASWAGRLWSEPMALSFNPVGGQYQGGEFKVEKLGTKTILGVSAEGILATRVFPAGLDGSNHPVTVAEERWYSADLQLTLINILEEPGVGRLTWELTTLDRAEPNPALFRAPAGYTIIDKNPATPSENSATATKPNLR